MFSVPVHGFDGCLFTLLAELWGQRRQQKVLQKKNQNLQKVLITQDLCPHNQLFESPPLSIYLESTIFRPNSHFLPQVSLSRSPTCPRPRLYGALTQQLLWSSVDYLAAALATCDVPDILPIQYHTIRHGSLALPAWYVSKWINNHFRSLHPWLKPVFKQHPSSLS